MAFMLKLIGNLSSCSYINHGHRPTSGGEEQEEKKRRRRRGKVTMGNSLRCCLACVLPCGALDVVRVVHLNGHVEEYSRQVFAGEILAANPNHVLSKPCSQGVGRQILILSPGSELKRGDIYFLIPASSAPEKRKKQQQKKKKQTKTAAVVKPPGQKNNLNEILSETKSGQRRHRSGRVGVWRPHLESIYEDP